MRLPDATSGRLAIMVAGVGVSACAGALFSRLGLPLAWVLGPLLVTAAITMSGRDVFAPTAARRVGQLIVGVSVGLHVTAEIAQALLVWLPVMVVATVVSIALSALLSVGLSRFGRVDGITAYYSTLPGGLAEMANVGAAEGARAEPIALAQAIRVGVVVCLLPPFIYSLGIHQDFYDENSGIIDFRMLALLFPVAIVGVLALTRLGMRNGWMVGSLIAVGIVAGLGLTHGQMPRPLFAFGQFLIGINVGARFKREIVAALPRLSVVCALTTVALSALLVVLAEVMTLVTPLDLATASLSVAPGGLAEMSSTAQILHLNVVLITGFHIIRAISVNAFATQFRRLFIRIGIFAAGDRMLAWLQQMLGKK